MQSGGTTKGRIFISCKREKHYNREVVLDQHALVYVLAGTLDIAYANQSCRFGPGAVVIIPRNEVGRLVKMPVNEEPFRSVSLCFRWTYCESFMQHGHSIRQQANGPGIWK